MRRCRAALGGEEGSAAVEFVLVGVLLTALTLGVLQLGIAVYVRNVVHDAAVTGAHEAALADAALDDGVARTRALIRGGVGEAYAGRSRPSCRATVSRSSSARRFRSSACGGRAVRWRCAAMRLARLWTERVRGMGDEGSAALEFIVAGLVLLAPVVYLVVALGQVQGQSLGLETARASSRASSQRRRTNASRANASSAKRRSSPRSTASSQRR